MKELHSPSYSTEQTERFAVSSLCFAKNGPYSFVCSESECLGVHGTSGIGKTLLLRALADLDPHTGTVLLDGRECADFPAPDWRRRVALVPAESRWWYPDVGDHLPIDYDRAAARELVQALGFSMDVLGWKVGRLSTGEKQRLAALRALIRQPSVLLLDEVGSGLDHQSCLLLEAVISAYRRQRKAAVIWVSHDREQLERVSDRVIAILRNGLAP